MSQKEDIINISQAIHCRSQNSQLFFEIEDIEDDRREWGAKNSESVYRPSIPPNDMQKQLSSFKGKDKHLKVPSSSHIVKDQTDSAVSEISLLIKQDGGGPLERIKL